MKVIMIKPMEHPAVVEVENTLESLQGVVGGRIEAVYPFDDPVAIVCNDEGKFNGMQFNRALVFRGHVYDYIMGPFFICGLGEENFTDIPDGLIEKYTKMYYETETLCDVGGRTILMRESDLEAL